MRAFNFFSFSSYKELLFKYPCVKTEGCLNDKNIWIRTSEEHPAIETFLLEKEANVRCVLSNEYLHEVERPNFAIVLPLEKAEESEAGYYEIMNHYIKFTQMLVHKMPDNNEFAHIVYILPQCSNQFSSKLTNMAYYALNGLAKGLGLLYAKKGIIVNAIILSDMANIAMTENWLNLLLSDNSNNIVGQCIEL